MTISGLIHTAVVLRSVRSNSTRTAQGEYVDSPTQIGASFAARLMYVSLQKTMPEAGAVVGDTADELVQHFEFLTDTFDDNGDPVVVTASDRLQFLDAGPLGTPTIDVTGFAEPLNNGRRLIATWGFGVIVQDTGSA